MAEFSLIISFLGLVFSLISVAVAISTYFHEVKMSYPKLKITPLPTKEPNQNLFIKYSFEDGYTYYIANILVKNPSAKECRFYNTSLKYKNYEVEFLNYKNIDNLPQDIKTLKDGISNNLYDFYNPSTPIPPFSEVIVTCVFKLPHISFLYLATNTSLKLRFKYYGEYCTRTTVKFNLYPLNYIDFVNQDFDETFSKIIQDIEKRRKESRIKRLQEIENRKTIKKSLQQSKN